MFDLSRHHAPIWPASLVPVGEGTFGKEAFAAWWARNRAALSHLHPDICEQWIHRHWTNSPFAFLPIDALSWTQVEMTTEEILDQVHRE